jgi:hypothetical protein
MHREAHHVGERAEPGHARHPDEGTIPAAAVPTRKERDSVVGSARAIRRLTRVQPVAAPITVHVSTNHMAPIPRRFTILSTLMYVDD